MSFQYEVEENKINTYDLTIEASDWLNSAYPFPTNPINHARIIDYLVQDIKDTVSEDEFNRESLEFYFQDSYKRFLEAGVKKKYQN